MRRISRYWCIINEILRVDAVVAPSGFRFQMTYRKHAKHKYIYIQFHSVHNFRLNIRIYSSFFAPPNTSTLPRGQPK